MSNLAIYKFIILLKLFGCFPDHKMERGDVADYYYEVQRFDTLVSRFLAALKNLLYQIF